MIRLRSLFRSIRSQSCRKRRNAQRYGATFSSTQSLEVRALLAGNVLAVVDSDGGLKLTGDSADNAVDVVIINNDVVVRGRENTTVNGSSTNFVAFANSSTIPDVFFARLGRGDDTLFVEGVTITGRAYVNGHSGRDNIGFDTTSIDRKLTIRSGRGSDVVSLDGVQVNRNLTVLTSKGDDTIRITDTNITNDVYIATGRHDDAVVLNTVTVGDDLRVFTSGGSDDLVITDSTINDRLRTGMGRGRDFVMLDGTAANGRTILRTNRHTDQVVVTNASRFGMLTVRAGGGSDAVEIDASTNVSGRQRIRSSKSSTVSTADREEQLNNATDGALTRSNAAETFFDSLSTTVTTPLSLAVDVSSNGATQSNDTLITNDASFQLAVTTQPGATVAVDSDADGQFDDGTTTADATGNATLNVTLANTNNGANVLNVQASNSTDTPLTEEVNVHFAQGTVVRFNSSLGTWDVELLDADAPNTVGAFLADLNRYNDTIVHREIDNFIIQGGGFSVNGTTVVDVPDFAAPPNEGNAVTPQNRNLRGTLSTAQTSNINSFTGQWFFNTVDNANLDNVPHAVFGNVIGTGMTIVDAINDVSNFNVTNLLSNASALTHVPLVNYTAGNTPTAANFVNINSVTEILSPQGTENTFRIFENSPTATSVGTVTPNVTSSAPTIFEFDAPAVVDELKLNADDHLEGNASAPIVLIEYISLQCPACAAVHPDVEQLLGDNSDDLIVVRRHLPNDTSTGGGFEHSFEAALAAEAAGRQGMFDEMVTQLFARQSEWTNSVSSQQAQAVFEDIAENTLNLNLSQFQTDMNDQALTDRINRDIADADSLNISATPTFFLNGNTQTTNGIPNTADVQAALQSLDPTFGLNRRTGEITVIDSTNLDFETTPTFTLNVNATRESTEEVQATVNLIDSFGA